MAMMYFHNNQLPEHVLASWRAEDWDDEKMVASEYTYKAMDEDGYFSINIELTKEQAALYSWGTCDDNLTGGSQAGSLQVKA